MENRLQYIFLIFRSAVFLLLLLPLVGNAQSDNKGKVGSEFIEVGLSVGVINIEDFPSESTLGLNLTFRATEDYFLQLNYIEAGDVGVPVAETDQGPTLFVDADDRNFKHYDLLLGYNIFQGEFFSSGADANLSSLYFVGGVGETKSFGENRFTYTVGLGYQVAFNRRYIVRMDVRDYNYKSVLIANDERVNNIHWSIGLSYLF
jgi:outer membrane beta-barrel protein